ncbi:AAA family ATPase, partial [Jatrophihabitans sp.]|uniref:AAA family ATPase n=1 Tax=Jatrophihabitans sp. TaxID=1932789 RepID=UPI002EF7DB07
ELRRRAGRRRADGPQRRVMYNPVVWLTGNQADLPHWLVGAPGVQVISVPRPLLADRLIGARSIVPQLPGGADLDSAEQEKLAQQLAFDADGLSLSEMRAAMMLARDRAIPAREFEQALSLQRYGLRRSPWQDPQIRSRVAQAESVLRTAVIGQERAVAKAVDILARSALGLSGAHSGSHPGRPQGVLFLAGPTGVGKTELAKQIANLVFGRADALVRFDMSEFSSEHTQARLLGSPPGYIGHEAGGELTNAVRDKPFSLLLFDEIDKADPRILDKFLQILEDGRLTDGAGSTVDFGQTMIIFTSNLGTLEKQADGTIRRVSYHTQADTFEDTVLANVRQTFIDGMKRPELLNRIGEKNILVLHYLSEEAARSIADRDLDTVRDTIRQATGVEVTVDDDARREVHAAVTQLPVLYNGGRGVGAEIEQLVVNPLSRALIAEPEAGAVTVTAGSPDGQLAFRITAGLVKAVGR